jgi:hypothetical protein
VAILRGYRLRPVEAVQIGANDDTDSAAADRFSVSMGGGSLARRFDDGSGLALLTPPGAAREQMALAQRRMQV